VAAPAFGSIGTHLLGSSSTASFAVPASVASGDIIVIPIFIDVAARSLTALASGFAHAEGSPIVGASNSLAVVWKRASGADTGTYDFTLDASTYRAGSAIRYTGCVSAGNPWDSGASTAFSDVNGTVTPSVSVTTAGPDRLLAFYASNWSGGAWTPPTAGGTWTERMDTGDEVNTADDLVQTSAGSSGSVTATCVGNDKRIAWLGALIGTTTAGGVPYSPPRAPQFRDPGEAWWLQRDRRDANTVAAAANPLVSPLDSTYGAGGQYWHLYNDTADAAPRARQGQQRSYSDPSLLSPAVTVPGPPAQRTIAVRDYGEAQWQQSSRRDPLLLTTALLENELLGGAETITRVTSPATNAPRWWMPQQPSREAFTPGLLDTAELEDALLAGDIHRHGHPAIYTDRREMPQQRPYISDPSFYPSVTPTDPLTLAFGAGGTYWQVYNTAATGTDRRRVPQQRAYISDPGLLATALLEGVLLGSGDTIRHLTWFTDRRAVPQQRVYNDPTLLATALLEGVLLGGGDTARHAFFITDRRQVPQQPARNDFAGATLADPITLLGDRWRRLAVPATHADRRETVPQRIALVFVGNDAPPIVKATSASAVSAGRTSTPVVTDRNASTAAVIARRTSSGGVT
jgi:hypothetical protein